MATLRVAPRTASKMRAAQIPRPGSAFELVDMNARLEAIERALPGPHVGSGAASNHEALQ